MQKGTPCRNFRASRNYGPRRCSSSEHLYKYRNPVPPQDHCAVYLVRSAANLPFHCASNINIWLQKPKQSADIGRDCHQFWQLMNLYTILHCGHSTKLSRWSASHHERIRQRFVVLGESQWCYMRLLTLTLNSLTLLMRRRWFLKPYGAAQSEHQMFTLYTACIDSLRMKYVEYSHSPGPILTKF